VRNPRSEIRRFLTDCHTVMQGFTIADSTPEAGVMKNSTLLPTQNGVSIISNTITAAVSKPPLTLQQNVSPSWGTP
jgi:hypothetical protein